MTFRNRALVRVGAGAVGLVAAGAFAAPVLAADGADLELAPMSSYLAKGVKEAKAKPFKFLVGNHSDAVDAEGVKVTVDVSGLNLKKVGYVVPDGCTAGDASYTCTLDSIPAKTSEEFGVPLFSVRGKGDAGTLKVTVTSTAADPDKANNTVEVPVEVTAPGYDLTTWTQDVYANVVVDGNDADEANLTPVAPGGTADLDWAIYNDGSRKAVGLMYVIYLPAGASFAELPKDCVEVSDEGQSIAFCEVADAVLKPGEYYTDTVRVKVAKSVTESVLTPGLLGAAALEDVAFTEPLAKPLTGWNTTEPADKERKEEVDGGDNFSLFDIFVGHGQTPPPGGGDGGGGGGLPVTGAEIGLIGGIGAAVLVGGAVIFLMARRRKVVLVTPDDGK